MIQLTIDVDFPPDAQIENVACEACNLASRLRVNVRFTFHTVRCTVYPAGSAAALVKNFLHALEGQEALGLSKLANNL